MTGWTGGWVGLGGWVGEFTYLEEGFAALALGEFLFEHAGHVVFFVAIEEVVLLGWVVG